MTQRVLSLSVAVLVALSLGSARAGISCDNLPQPFCSTSCGLSLIAEKCCECYGSCCPKKEELIERAHCNDGETSQVECNVCKCKHGYVVCTGHDCISSCPDGTHWQVDCNKCYCIGGQPSCTERVCDEPPQCTEGETTLVDCNICTCINGHLVCTLIACDADGGSPPNTPSNCTDSGGNLRPHNSIWSGSDPCDGYQCHDGHIRPIKRTCPDTPPPGCFEPTFQVANQCCPTYYCPDPTRPPSDDQTCTDKYGRVHNNGETWRGLAIESQCTLFTCRNGLTVTSQDPACQTPAPPTLPTLPTVPTPPSDDQTCTDKYGRVHNNGETWRGLAIESQCTLFTCHNGRTLTSRDPACQTPAPPTLPTLPTVPTPPSDDQTCTDKYGRVHNNGETWRGLAIESQCTLFTCHNGRTLTSRDPACQTPEPPTLPTLPTVPTPPSDDQTCTDKYGRVHNNGETWRGLAIESQCTLFTCRNGLTVTSQDPACQTPTLPSPPTVPTPPPTRPTLPAVPSHCVESSGQVRSHGDRWQKPADPCTYYHCSFGHIHSSAVTCHPPPPHCTTGSPIPGHCCPATICTAPTLPTVPTTPSTQATPPATFPTQGTPPTPPSGDQTSCTDPITNFQYGTGSVWFSRPGSIPCRRSQCNNGAITAEFSTGSCQPPPSGCYLLSGAPAGCCPAYICLLSSCVDDDGVNRAHGSTWAYPSSPCSQYRCENGQIAGPIPVQCAPPPFPGCQGTFFPGQCCPVYGSCSTPTPPSTCQHRGVTYQHGDQFPDDPDHPCATNRCDQGIVVTLTPPVSCLPLSCSEANTVWPQGECCRRCEVTSDPNEPDLIQLVSQIQELAQSLQVTQLLQLEGALQQLQQAISQISQATPGASVVTVVQRLIRVWQIFGFGTFGNASSTNISVLTELLQSQLFALRDALSSSLTPDQIQNATIDIQEFIQWLLAYDRNNPANTTSIIIQDILRLLTNLLTVAGCYDTVGNVYPLNTFFVDTPVNPVECYVCGNSTGTPAPLLVLNIPDSCGGQPPAGCVQRAVPNQCCPDVDCGAGADPCTDEKGNLHPSGTTFVDDPIRPCITYSCRNGVITVVDSIDCPELPPGCTAWHMEGQCCPKADCPEDPCVHAGRERDHGTSWPQDPQQPCIILTCLNGDISSQDNSVLCPSPPADPSCVARPVPNQCCPAYDCVSVNCTYNGQVYQEDETWQDSPLYPCKTFRCTKTGPLKIADLTDDCPEQPRPDCEGVRVPGQCCKTWECNDCQVDGVTYPEGQVWWDNDNRQCIQFTCRAGIVVQLQNLLPCPDVPSNCRANFAGVACCHVKYTCPFCMFDPQGNFIEMVQ